MTLPEAFSYEASRIFSDRLEPDALDKFNAMLQAVASAHLNFRCGRVAGKKEESVW